MLSLAAVLVLAALIGGVVGLLGGGGSVLLVPLLAFGYGLAPASAVTTSLLVVAMTSAAALVPHAMAGRVRWGTGLLFGPAGMAGAYAGGELGGRLPDAAVMTLFGAMMAASAWGMLRRRAVAPARPVAAPPLARIIALGAGVGLVTGVVGAGGGFLIVPALVCLLGLPVRVAVGTSLLVITMNALAGVAGRAGQVDIDWGLTLAITGVAVLGAVLGSRLTGKVPDRALRLGFGWLIVAMAALVLWEQVPW